MSTQENQKDDTQNTPLEEEKNENSSPDDAGEDEESSEITEDLPNLPQTDEEKIASLTAELESVNAKLSETHDKMLRIAADSENTRKRLAKEKMDTRLYAIQDFAGDLLPVIDAFDKALQTIDQSDEDSSEQTASIVEGVKLVSKVFTDTIKKHGIERVPGKDAPFDPNFHNAIAKETDKKYESEVVIEEFMTGYKIADRVLRTALVKVGSPD